MTESQNAVAAVKFYQSIQTVLNFDNDLSPAEKREIAELALEGELEE